ncbi:MAG: hypothetical protein GY778_11970, partial [bacterium]|nr:hypothetical protein [bacterium]
IIRYLPSNAYVVRLSADQANRVRTANTVRWVGDYHPAFRVDPELIAANTFNQKVPVRYNIVVADKRTDKPALMQKVLAIGGSVDSEQVGGLLLEVTLTGPQLLQAAGFDEVLWIDRWTPDGEDVDNARIQGGANYVEGLAGYSGVGLNAHIYEGIDAGHQGFSGPVANVRSGGAWSGHGTNTAGIVFGDG